MSARSTASTRGIRLWLLALVLLAAAGHILLLRGGPWVFYDELGYQKLAQSLGETGQFALLNKHGLSYSPLYPLLLSPLYAFHLSGPAAYHWARVINCLLLAIAIVPIYRIARFVLSPGRSIAAAALSSLAPLMLFSSFVMSENLAYPLFLCAVWAMLVTIRSPGVRADAVVLAVCFLAAATRIQFVTLVPAALLAVLLAAIVESRGSGLRWHRSLGRALREHLVLAGANVALAAGAVAVIAGSRLVALAGRYANQRNLPLPSPWQIVDLLAQHVAGLDLTIGVVPFVGTLVAAALWLRRGGSTETGVFVAVAVSVASVVLVGTAFAAYGQTPGPHAGDLPRIHERYFFYLVPLFVIAMVAALGIPRSTSLLRLGLAVAALGALLPAAIPFRTVINHTVGIDSFGLVMFAKDAGKRGVVALPHATILAVGLALCFGFFYALARPKLVLVVALVAVIFAWMSLLARNTQVSAARTMARASFAGRWDWVDAAVRGHRVVIVENPRLPHGVHGLGVAETVFFNLSVARLYYPCRPVLSAEFGEDQVELDFRGRLRDRGALVRAKYAIVPADHGIVGRVIAADVRARLVLVEPANGILRVAPGRRDRWACRSNAA